jgi:DNA-binding transcriptional ArsR family regulator
VSTSNLPEPAVEDVDLAAVMHALSDPVRLEIAARLVDGPEACAALGDNVEVHKSTMSHHYRVLREAGVTRTEIRGRQRWMSLRTADLDARFPGLIGAVTGAARAKGPGAPRD